MLVDGELKLLIDIQLFQKTLSEEKQKAFNQDQKVIWDFYNDLLHVPENSMERLSVSESISKHWTTLKTEVVGGPSNSRELKQIQWRQLNLHTFLSVAVAARLWLEMFRVLLGK